MGDVARVLIVCTGNICRSPFIERLLQHQLDEHWLHEQRLHEQPLHEQRLHEQRLHEGRPTDRAILVHSAGTAALTGSAMDERAAARLVGLGGDPVEFRARALTPDLIAGSDLVLTATRWHRGKVAEMYPKALRQVFTFRDFADLVAGIDGPRSSVPHPDPKAWVRHVTEKAAASRGLKPPLEPAQADIVDPFRREDGVFDAMAQQIVESMPAVVRALAG
jgi:protein-tyrosine phosphatase